MPVNYGSQIDEHHAVRRDAGMFDVSHMRVVDLDGDGADAPRAFLRHALANNVDKLKTPGKALYSCLLRRRRRRPRRPDRLLPARGLLPARRQRRAPPTRTSPGSRRSRAQRAPRLAHHAARRSRDDRGAGPARARARSGSACPAARRRRADAEAVQRGVRATPRGASCSSRAPATPARTASRSSCRPRTRRRCGRRCVAAGVDAVRARRARHAAPRSGHEPLRPGHGRNGVAARVGPRLDGRPRERARLRRQGGARSRNPRARSSSGLVLQDAGGVLRAHQTVHTGARRRRDHERHVFADDEDVDRARAAARRRSPIGDDRARRRSRQAARRARRQAAVRAPRQEFSSQLNHDRDPAFAKEPR